MAVSYAELVAFSSDGEPRRVHFYDAREFVGQIRKVEKSARRQKEQWAVIDSETDEVVIFSQEDIARIVSLRPVFKRL